jgi:hypothetical protein
MSTSTPTAQRRSGVPASLQDGPGGHRVEEAHRAVSIRPIARLAQGQEPGQPGDAASPRGVVVMVGNRFDYPIEPMTLGNNAREWCAVAGGQLRWHGGAAVHPSLKPGFRT